MRRMLPLLTVLVACGARVPPPSASLDFGACPSYTHDPPESCEALPPNHGLSPHAPLEWGTMARAPKAESWLERLVCADGTTPGTREQGILPALPSSAPRDRRDGRQPGDEELLVMGLLCEGTVTTLYLNPSRCGAPCPPAGFSLMPWETVSDLDATYLLLREGEQQAALARIRQTVERSPGIWIVHLAHGMAALESGALEEALDALESAYAIDPGEDDDLGMLIQVVLRRIAERDAGSPDLETLLRSHVQALSLFSEPFCLQREDPPDPAECEGLPPGLGLSPELPFEWGDAARGSLWQSRLVCADGSAVTAERQGNHAAPPSDAPRRHPTLPEDELVDAWSVWCPGDEAPRAWYTNMYRCGPTCVPEGFSVLPPEVVAGLDEVRELAELEQFEEAMAAVRVAAERWPHLQVVHIYHLVTALRAGVHDDARRALEAARGFPGRADDLDRMEAELEAAEAGGDGW